MDEFSLNSSVMNDGKGRRKIRKLADGHLYLVKLDRIDFEVDFTADRLTVITAHPEMAEIASRQPRTGSVTSQSQCWIFLSFYWFLIHCYKVVTFCNEIYFVLRRYQTHYFLLHQTTLAGSYLPQSGQSRLIDYYKNTTFLKVFNFMWEKRSNTRCNLDHAISNSFTKLSWTSPKARFMTILQTRLRSHDPNYNSCWILYILGGCCYSITWVNSAVLRPQ